MSNEKKSFLIYCDLIHTVEKLDDEQSGKLLKHILRYVNNKEPEPENQIIDLVFEPIKLQLKRDLIRYESIVSKRSKAGKASAKKRAQNSTHVKSVEQNPTNPTDTIVTDTDTDTVTVTVTGIENDILLEKETKVYKPKKFTTSDFKKTFLDLGVDEIHLDDWLKVRKGKKAVNSQTALKNIVEECNKHEFPISEAIKKCAENSWSGFKYEWLNNISTSSSKEKPKTINRQTEEVIRQNAEPVGVDFIERIRNAQKRTS